MGDRPISREFNRDPSLQRITPCRNLIFDIWALPGLREGSLRLSSNALTGLDGEAARGGGRRKKDRCQGGQSGGEEGMKTRKMVGKKGIFSLNKKSALMKVGLKK